ncbi:MAG TPA: carboxylating nicotinate-nucleotide diphosphorylase [Chthoniobacterales bacterium]|jgi:nicotinate-nucleotide pyrophosphorylase (carboxylating)|nr:carboxylating nicotinate-nucleotide diphosphorylase [Chthoniobacterales bacterium]
MKTHVVDPIEIALREDIGDGDLTTEFFVDKNQLAAANIVARESAILAGVETAAEVFRRVDATVEITSARKDGDEINASENVLGLRGPAHSILKAERVALNFLQRLSGIATMTRKFVQAAASEHVKILDTRKTTPGLRALEKAAVVAGGGMNHRFGLFDMVMLKDNHLAVAGFDSLPQALRQFRETHPNIQIEVEADTLEQVRRFLEIDGIDVVLLDNMKPAQIREAIAIGKGKVKFEASGGVTLKNIRQIAATGVDYISIGALTHSPRAIDFSLELAPIQS